MSLRGESDGVSRSLMAHMDESGETVGIIRANLGRGLDWRRHTQRRAWGANMPEGA
jgi:hypothetical protein